ncbi:MAG: iron-containing alcohol dehydrogenase [Promethearchaeota archaeon]
MVKEQPMWYETEFIRGLLPMMTGKSLRGIQSSISIPKIFKGETALITTAAWLNAMLEDSEKRALLITDDFTEKYAKRVGESLERVGFEYKVWSGARPEVPVGTIEEGMKACEEFKPIVVFAIGGGSVMDTAKCVLIRYDRPTLNLFLILPMDPSIGLRKKFKYFIAIPTTSGTGSEVTATSVVTNNLVEPPQKVVVQCPDTVPDIAILDPYFVKDMPPFLTMGSGLDAFAHSVGAYVSNFGSPFFDAINLTAIEETMKYLPRAVKYGAKDMEARAHMQMAATTAGIGFGNTVAGIDHALGHGFGKVYNVHHGVSVGLFLPYSVAFQAKILDRWQGLARIFGVELTGDDREKDLQIILQAIKDFIHSVDGPVCVKELKNPVISEDEYRNKMEYAIDYADKDVVSLLSSRPLSRKQIAKIFEYAWDGKDVDF